MWSIYKNRLAIFHGQRTEIIILEKDNAGNACSAPCYLQSVPWFQHSCGGQFHTNHRVHSKHALWGLRSCSRVGPSRRRPPSLSAETRRRAGTVMAPEAAPTSHRLRLLANGPACPGGKIQDPFSVLPG